jgi:hypothetical protein
MKLPVARHRPPHRGGARWGSVGAALAQQTLHAKAPRAWILALDLEHLFEQGQGQLIRGMIGGAAAVILQALQAVALKGGQDMGDMLAREQQTAGDTLLLPALGIQAHHLPAGAIGILKLVEGFPGQGELDGDGMLGEKAGDGMVVGGETKLVGEDAHDFAIVNGGIELFEIENVGGDGLGEGLGFAPGLGSALIDQAEHTALEKPAGLVAHDGAGDPDLLAAVGDRLVAQNDRADGLVVVLNGIDEAELELLKIVGCVHGLWSPETAGISVARRRAKGRRPKTGLGEPGCAGLPGGLVYHAPSRGSQAATGNWFPPT